MLIFHPCEPIAVSVVNAIHSGDLCALKSLLNESPSLAGARIGEVGPGKACRTLLHVATDWPGHFPKAAKSVTLLIKAGSDVNARFVGSHAETPLH